MNFKSWLLLENEILPDVERININNIHNNEINFSKHPNGKGVLVSYPDEWFIYSDELAVQISRPSGYGSKLPYEVTILKTGFEPLKSYFLSNDVYKLIVDKIRSDFEKLWNIKLPPPHQDAYKINLKELATEIKFHIEAENTEDRDWNFWQRQKEFCQKIAWRLSKSALNSVLGTDATETLIQNKQNEIIETIKSQIETKSKEMVSEFGTVIANVLPEIPENLDKNLNDFCEDLISTLQKMKPSRLVDSIDAVDNCAKQGYFLNYEGTYKRQSVQNYLILIADIRDFCRLGPDLSKIINKMLDSNIQ